MEWHALHRILDLVTLHVGAHIRDGRHLREGERAEFGSPQEIENFFSGKKGQDIPDDYFEKFQRMCTTINRWIRQCHVDSEKWSGRWQYKAMVTHVIYVKLRCGHKMVEIEKVMVRPCAEQCGFWKRLLNSIRKEIQEYPNLDFFTIAMPYETNFAILGNLGFEPSENGDMIIRGSILKQVTSWEPTKNHPSAAELNDPNFVNRKLKHDYVVSEDELEPEVEVESEEGTT